MYLKQQIHGLMNFGFYFLMTVRSFKKTKQLLYIARSKYKLYHSMTYPVKDLCTAAVKEAQDLIILYHTISGFIIL